MTCKYKFFILTKKGRDRHFAQSALLSLLRNCCSKGVGVADSQARMTSLLLVLAILALAGALTQSRVKDEEPARLTL